MSPHGRSSSTSNVRYQAIPQAPTGLQEGGTSLRQSLELGTHDEDLPIDQPVFQESTLTVDGRVRWIHFVLGCAVLLPWNAIITATPFFVARLDGSPLKSTFSSYLSTSFTLSNFAFLAHATLTANQSTNASRALSSMLWLALLTFMFTLSTFVKAPPGLFFAFVLLNGVAQAAAGSYLQTSIVAVASLFGPSVMQAVMAGQAAVGVAVSAVQVISAAASVHGSPLPKGLQDTSPEESSARAFFALSTAFLLFSAAAHAVLIRLPSYKVAVSQFQTRRSTHSGEDDVNSNAGIVVSEPAFNKTEKRNQIRRVLRANIVYYVAVAYVFVVTLAVFPPITVSIASTNPVTHPLLFSATHFLVFNTGDLIGRYMCAVPRLLVWSARHLFSMSLARTCFIPLFLMCNIQRGFVVTSSPIINSDTLYMLILLAFGVSNGYVSSLCMMSAPSIEHNPHFKTHAEDVDVAATLASFLLMGGLVIGSFASFAVRAAICGCNPFIG